MKSILFAGAGVLTAIALSGCVSSEEVSQMNDEHGRQVKQLTRDNTELQKRNEDLEAALAGKGFKPVGFEDWMKELEGRLSDDLRKALSDLEKSGDITSLGNGGYRIEEDVLFDSGQASVKSKGQEVLHKFASIFKGQDVRFRIDGHTDSDPVVVHKKEWGRAGNWELAFFRAYNVAETLSKAGIPMKRTTPTSWADTNPRFPNDTRANKQKNRRVEIWVQPNK